MPRLFTLASLPSPKTTLVADCMRAKYLLKMEQALTWRRSLDLATLKTGAAGLPAVGQLLEGVDAYPEAGAVLRPAARGGHVHGQGRPPI